MGGASLAAGDTRWQPDGNRHSMHNSTDTNSTTATIPALTRFLNTLRAAVFVFIPAVCHAPARGC